MGVEIMVPLGLFAMVVAIVFISINGGTQKRKAALTTVEEAIRAGQQLTPELVRSLGMPHKDRGGDLKSGAILLAVAIAFVVLGWTISGVEEDAAEAVRIMGGIAAFPGFIGLVLIGFGLMGSKKDAD
ncbi:DUF6249 domain-containing protein [uncultured Maricaulis sp.]|uniref:DUF6249 domain-containing protein n=1 Tax=uncultured Maricaulis sp. TaxID=174710 RepID=UPI0030DC0021|tara:strand:+ start:172317 stop:172700 length:384 start_codon:yes stop_codon:yes gene_type:complete